MKKRVLLFLLLFIITLMILLIFLLFNNDKHPISKNKNVETKAEITSTTIEIKEDSNTIKKQTTLNVSSEKTTKKKSSTTKNTKKKKTTSSITTEKSTSKKISTTTKVVTSKSITTQTTTVTTTTTQTITESCEKKFLFSWFRPDFESESECVAMGEKYLDPYGYNCYYMQDNCGNDYYMLRLWINEEDWFYYKDISLSE